MKVFKRFDPRVKKILKGGGVGVIPTDTIYGISGSAFSRKAVKRIYGVKKRSAKSPFIVLIASLGDLKKFGVPLDKDTRRFLRKCWPGKVSVILRSRGGKSVAFRMPRYPALRKLLKAAGPLVSTSANLSGKAPAATIGEAQAYFGERVDFYVDAGKMKSLPSTLVEMKDGKPAVLRPGAFDIGTIRHII